MLLLAAAFLAAAAIPAAAPSDGPGAKPPVAGATNCPRTSSYLANQSGLYRGRPLTPKKLTELPPGITYMAVFRHIGPCEAPLTMTEYRNPRRR